MDEIVKSTDFELSVGQNLGKVVIAAGAGFLASEMSKKAFDAVVKLIRSRKGEQGS